MPDIFPLPDKILLQDFNGDFSAFFLEVYNIFKRDFINTKPIFEGKRLGLKCHPLIDGYEYTFYHFTHSGDIENEREPDIGRMERIRFPKPMIESSSHPYLKIWRNRHGKDNRVLIYHQEEKYLVVLADRGDYILPWTAYMITYNNRERRLLKEYEAYKRQNRSI